MAKKKKLVKLSLGEFRLMAILWERGPLTLAETYEFRPAQTAYSTIQTQLNRLVEKGAVSRTKKRPMKYRAVIEPQEAADRVLDLLVQSIGGGSIVPLVTQLLQNSSLTPADAKLLKQMIDDVTIKPVKATKRVVRKKKSVEKS